MPFQQAVILIDLGLVSGQYPERQLPLVSQTHQVRVPAASTRAIRCPGAKDFDYLQPDQPCHERLDAAASFFDSKQLSGLRFDQRAARQACFANQFQDTDVSLKGLCPAPGRHPFRFRRALVLRGFMQKEFVPLGFILG